MRLYGNTLGEKNGLKLVEVLAEGLSDDGKPMVVGYAILALDGTEIDQFALSELNAAWIEFNKQSEKSIQSPDTSAEEDNSTLIDSSITQGSKPKFRI